MTSGPTIYRSSRACADEIVNRLGTRINAALPLGLGKANHLINALYERAREDPDIELNIFTALSLSPPALGSGLQRRFLGPFVERQFGGCTRLAYEEDRRRGELPGNVNVYEFFFDPGRYLSNENAQQHYISTNYTHALRDLLARGVNLLLQMVARPDDASNRLSLSCNPDLSLALIDRPTGSRPLLVAGEVNRQLPYLSGSAELSEDQFDLLLDEPDRQDALFAIPNSPVGLDEYARAAHVAGLIADGGTLQIGIGSLGDSVAHVLGLRHLAPDRFRALHADVSSAERRAFSCPELVVEQEPFDQGLYGLSEMVVEGLLHLRRVGVLTRTVSDPNTGRPVYLHGGFFLGSARFYETLRTLDEHDADGLDMTRIDYINQLYCEEAAKRAARTKARFVNSTMMVDVSGAAASDTLSDGRVVSGVGGQYNFVAMAHELADARSILALPATRMRDGTVTSNIVAGSVQSTIPRHLRDIVVTEYGVADLRGQSDTTVAARLIAIADSRFQAGLIRDCQARGKLPSSYRLPDEFHNNRPGTLARAIRPDLLPHLPRYPLGTDLTPAEATVRPALDQLSSLGSSAKLALLRVALRGLREARRGRGSSESWCAALSRMDLEHPRKPADYLLRWLVLGALAEVDTGQPDFQAIPGSQS